MPLDLPQQKYVLAGDMLRVSKALCSSRFGTMSTLAITALLLDTTPPPFSSKGIGVNFVLALSQIGPHLNWLASRTSASIMRHLREPRTTAGVRVLGDTCTNVARLHVFNQSQPVVRVAQPSGFQTRVDQIVQTKESKL